MSASTRITKLEKTIRAKAREDFEKAIDADFKSALERTSADTGIAQQLNAVKREYFKARVKAHEDHALELFLDERAPIPRPALIDIGALYNPVEVRIAANGERLPDTAENYVAVLYPQFVDKNGLSPLYSIRAEVLPNWQAAVEAGPKFELFNDKGEWQLWDDVEASLTINRRANNPAVHAAFAKHTPTDEIYWTRTPHPSSSDCAFYVLLRYGSVSWGYRAVRGRARFVRLVPASQF